MGYLPVVWHSYQVCQHSTGSKLEMAIQDRHTHINRIEISYTQFFYLQSVLKCVKGPLIFKHLIHCQ